MKIYHKKVYFSVFTDNKVTTTVIRESRGHIFGTSPSSKGTAHTHERITNAETDSRSRRADTDITPVVACTRKG